MSDPSRRNFVKWICCNLLLVPGVTAAKMPPLAQREPTAAERSHAVFSGLLPEGADCLLASETLELFAAIFETRLPEADLHDQFKLRWLCLAVKSSPDAIAAQVSSDVLDSWSPWHPVDVTLEIKDGFVEVYEDKLRGHTHQKWKWSGSTWLLAARESADVHCGHLTLEEYNSNQSKVVVATGRIDSAGFDSVQHVRIPESIGIANYPGGPIAT